MEPDEVQVDEEGTESEEDLGHQDLAEYSKAVLWGTDWTAETIVNQLNKGNIELNPEFQRRDAWDITKKSRFIESLILGLPVPPIILAEESQKKNAYIVIDGKQRLLSIMQFCASSNDPSFRQLRLSGLEILTKLNGYNYQNLTEVSDSNDYKTQFDNQTIRTVVVRNWKNEKFLYTVFLRLNNGSLKLSPQELRQALHPGDFLVFVNDYSTESKGIRGILNLKRPDPRMRDVELLIRYFAFRNFEGEYKGSLKDFLDESCEKLNKQWEENQENIKKQAADLEDAISFTTEVFGEKQRFSKYIRNNYTGIFNRTMFDIMTMAFADSGTREKLKPKMKQIKLAFEDVMMNNKRFVEAVSGSTKDLDKTRDRQTIWKEALAKISA